MCHVNSPTYNVNFIVFCMGEIKVPYCMVHVRFAQVCCMGANTAHLSKYSTLDKSKLILSIGY